MRAMIWNTIIVWKVFLHRQPATSKYKQFYEPKRNYKLTIKFEAFDGIITTRILNELRRTDRFTSVSFFTILSPLHTTNHNHYNTINWSEIHTSHIYCTHLVDEHCLVECSQGCGKMQKIACTLRKMHALSKLIIEWCYCLKSFISRNNYMEQTQQGAV